MRKEKKQLEILLLDSFRNNYPDFPKGKVIPAESPDFWVRSKGRNVIGIELTRLFPQSAATNGGNRGKLIVDFVRPVELAQEIFESHLSRALFVKVLFDVHNPISAEREMSVAVRIAGLVRGLFESFGDHSLHIQRFGEDVLPAGVKMLWVMSHPALKTGIWEPANKLGVSVDVVADIHRAIAKKEGKLQLYYKNHLNLYWLLITTDLLTPAQHTQLHNQTVREQFRSRFQKVFLLELLSGEVFEL